MKLVFLSGLFLLASCSSFKHWESKGEFKNPESAYYDKESGFIFVSNVNGNPHVKDNNGFISKLSKEGEVLTLKWVKGLNAPKGLRAYDGHLWVADIDKIKKIEIKTAKVVKTIKLPGAKMLNDIFVVNNESVYVSDTFGSSVYFYDGKKASILFKGKKYESPNGLYVKGDTLYVAAWGYTTTNDWATKTPGRLYKVDLKTKAVSFITKEPLGNLDGLEMDSNGDFIVSDWVSGKLLRVNDQGASEVIHQGQQGLADFSLLDGDVALLPIMTKNRIYTINL